MRVIARRPLLATCIATALLAACQHTAVPAPGPATPAPAATATYAQQKAPTPAQANPDSLLTQFSG